MIEIFPNKNWYCSRSIALFLVEYFRVVHVYHPSGIATTYSSRKTQFHLNSHKFYIFINKTKNQRKKLIPCGIFMNSVNIQFIWNHDKKINLFQCVQTLYVHLQTNHVLPTYYVRKIDVRICRCKKLLRFHVIKKNSKANKQILTMFLFKKKEALHK